MHLYSLSLQQPTAITKAVLGFFSGNVKQQEIIVARGKVIEILKVDANGKLIVMHSQEIFGLIRNIAPFKLPGIKHDFVLVLSDSGRIVIIEYDPEKNQFQKVHQETYGKSGCRRIVPGQHIAIDSMGRACMIGAIEKQKFVYILNSENNKLTISSPLEANKSHTICFDMVGLDTQLMNAQFACLESDYGDQLNKDSSIWTGKIQKTLIVYSLDLGLNHVFRLSSDTVPESAHMLLPVPGQDGPGGLIILCEDFLIYKGDKTELKLYYPRRIQYTINTQYNRSIIINCYGFVKQKEVFFFILQTELGDLFKLQFNYTKQEVHSITLSYFDSIPVAVSLCVLKKGYLFAPAEKGNHNLYKFISLGDEDEDKIKTDTTMTVQEQQSVFFFPKALKNLEKVDELQNLTVISDLKSEDLTGEGTPQIYTLCAAGSQSTIRVLRHGLSVNEMAQSPLPSKPTGIWTIPKSYEDHLSKYIVISFQTNTLVLSISDKVVEVQNSGMDLKRQTLLVQLLEDNSILQVVPNGFKHITADSNKQNINNWLTEQKVVKATSNTRQLAIALQTNELIYFEVDSLGKIYEVEKIQLDSEVVCMHIGDIPQGRQRCKFLAVGLSNHTVRILSLDPDTPLQKLAIQALPASVSESVCLLEMGKEPENSQHENIESQLFLYVGMNNGILLRASVDSITGNLSDIRTRFLGTKPVRCFQYSVKGVPALLALSSKPWICYTYYGRYFNTPLSYDPIEYCSVFNTEDCVEGIVSCCQNSLRIIIPENYGELLNQKMIYSRYTPRKMQINQQWKNLVILESEHRVFPVAERENLKRQIYQKYGKNVEEALLVDETQVGTLLAPEGRWASCIRILDPNELKTEDIVELDQNEHPVSMTLADFYEFPDQQFLVVGVVRDLITYPSRNYSQASLYVYQFLDKGRKLEFVHKTIVDDIPYSLSLWKGKLLAGVGHCLRVYEMGKKKLLKKAELKELNSPVINIQYFGDRIFCGEMADSVHVFKFRHKDQSFQEVADDILPRWITSFQVLDYHTIVATDKFENAFVSRIPTSADNDIEDNPQLYKLRWEQGFLNGAPFKMEQICNFYVGEIVTNIQKTSLVSTGTEVLLYGTTMGSIGAFYHFETKEDIDFFLHLELHLRLEAQPLCGREHITFRSYYGPCKSVIDGDLCEQYVKLNYSKQKVLAEELERAPADVHKKLEEIRNKIL